MDYEIMMNRSLKLGQYAPGFEAETTKGPIMLENYKGKWVVFFSYAGDFTPICTSEIIELAKACEYFEKINTKLIRVKFGLKQSTYAMDI